MILSMSGEVGCNRFIREPEPGQDGFAVWPGPEAIAAIHNFFYGDVSRFIAVHV